MFLTIFVSESEYVKYTNCSDVFSWHKSQHKHKRKDQNVSFSLCLRLYLRLRCNEKKAKFRSDITYII